MAGVPNQVRIKWCPPKISITESIYLNIMYYNWGEVAWNIVTEKLELFIVGVK